MKIAKKLYAEFHDKQPSQEDIVSFIQGNIPLGETCLGGVIAKLIFHKTQQGRGIFLNSMLGEDKEGMPVEHRSYLQFNRKGDGYILNEHFENTPYSPIIIYDV